MDTDVIKHKCQILIDNNDQTPLLQFIVAVMDAVTVANAHVIEDNTTIVVRAMQKLQHQHHIAAAIADADCNLKPCESMRETNPM
jgi:riboflavin biosynthesis pyrimidine reductase